MMILHVSGERTLRGGERQALLLARLQAGRGMDVAFAARAGSEVAAAARSAGLATTEAPMRADMDLASAARLAALVRRLRPDVVHAHSPRALSLAFLATAGDLAAVINGRASAATVGQRRPVRLATRRVARPPSGPLGGLKFRLLADRHIAISQAVREALVASGVPAGRVTVVPGAVEPEPTLTREAARAALGVPADALVAGTVGFLVPEKGHADLLAAHAMVPGAILVVIGDGPEAARLRRLAGPGVVFAGHRDDARRLLSALDVFVLASRQEGLSCAAIEAQAAGVPVVAPRVGGLVEAVGDGETGVLVEPGSPRALADAMAMLLSDPARARRLGEAGRARVASRFCPEALVSATESVYLEAIRDRR